MENPKKICSIDVARMQRKLACIPYELWNKRTQRKSHHPDTKHIAILWPKSKNFKENYWTDEFSLFEEELKPIFKTIQSYYNSEIIRVLFTNILPGGKILPHVDDGPMDVICHRLHIPIVTNPEKIIFILDGHRRTLLEGILYEIDIRSEHSVENHWEFSRTHLVMDVLRKS